MVVSSNGRGDNGASDELPANTDVAETGLGRTGTDKRIPITRRDNEMRWQYGTNCEQEPRTPWRSARSTEEKEIRVICTNENVLNGGHIRKGHIYLRSPFSERTVASPEFVPGGA